MKNNGGNMMQNIIKKNYCEELFVENTEENYCAER